jgi:uncharacterized protein
MSERSDYTIGVPCWVDALPEEPSRTADFYAEILGWELDDRLGPDGPGSYYVGRLGGRAVAAVGTPPATDLSPAWITYIRVDDVDAAARRAVESGGRVVHADLPTVDGDRRVLLADPAGATFGIRQSGLIDGAELVNEPGAWSISILNTGDAEAAKAFYGGMFGWTTSAVDAGGVELTMWQLPGYFGGEPSQPVPRDVVAVMAPLPDGDDAARWDVNFWIDDADAAAAKTEELGGTVLAAPTDQPPFREAVIADPAGAAMAISQFVGPP